MSGRVKHKSRGSERSTGRHKTKKSSKHSSSASDDCVIVIPHRNSCNKDKRRKTEKKKRRRSPSSSSSISNCSIKRLKLVDSSQQLLGERPEFCRNGASYRGNSGVTKFSQGTHKLHSADRTLAGFRSRERTSDKQRQEQYAMYERRVLYKAASEKERSRKRSTNAVEKSGLGSSKSKKSHKRRRSSSSSRSSSPNSRSSSSSSSTSSITSSSSSDYERRRKQRKRKKKLARKMKLEKKRRQDEKRKMKKAKEKFKEPVQGIKRSISKTAKDRLLHDINVELADRARAMAPMTKEQWEKKQSVVRRVYDEETGRHRLIKGDGEVLEEIVSRDRHMEINRNATKGDGEFFQSRIRVNK